MDGGRKRDYFHSLNYTLPRSHVNREARMHARGLFIQLPSIQGPFLHRVRTILLARSTKSQTDFFPRYSTRRIDACDARNKGSLNEAEGRGRGVLRPRPSFSLEIGRNASVRGSFVLRRNCGYARFALRYRVPGRNCLERDSSFNQLDSILIITSPYHFRSRPITITDKVCMQSRSNGKHRKGSSREHKEQRKN